MIKILVVDDDSHIRELISAILKSESINAIEANDGEDAINKLTESKIDLCIIDIMMPKIDGFELCETIREYYKNIPIIMLTAKTNISDKLRGFNKGTDDYLTKPFEPEELLARVKSLLRRYNIEENQIIKIGPLVINKKDYIVSVNNKVINMPLKEFELLVKLANGAGKTITRERLIEDIWGFDFDGNERTLDVHINRLRDKFKDYLKITTIRGLGYRLEEFDYEE